MPKNEFFRFKQFTIFQDQCAMKVCTDSCVLGAWADLEGADKILDIGAGTGLLSLMAAQRNTHAEIDAVEVDSEAFHQASENAGKSPFAGRIQVIHSAIQNFHPARQYDCIVTNPPFFQSDLRSPSASVNVAHHAESLSFDALIGSLERLLTGPGSFHILLPMDEGRIFYEKTRKSGWRLIRQLTLFHHTGKRPFRLLMQFEREEMAGTEHVAEELCIYEPDGKTYDPAFVKLMKAFYLKF